MAKWKDVKPYWGDLHSHCNISYGHGSLDYALEMAREHLDFCSITGHSSWPDMPTDRSQYGEVIDYHNRGFARLEANWPKVIQKVDEANEDGSFVTFSSYEWHSLEFGDHNIYLPGDNAPLLMPEDIRELHQVCDEFDAMAIPHHIGYPQGLRGGNWTSFSERHSPVIEIFSMHGCAESDSGPYPYLHDMGPRTTASTVVAGLRQGHRFGFIASTDNHAGYPGHLGGGRTAVFAEGLSRADIWEAIRQRKVYAVTGDRIVTKMWVNEGFMGDVIHEENPDSPRMIQMDIEASDRIDYIELVRNGKPISRIDRLENEPASISGPMRAKVRVEWGWGDKHKPFHWQGELFVDGEILSYEPCFRGACSLSPEELDRLGDDLPRNRIVNATNQVLEWESTTLGNPSLLHPSTCSMIVEILADYNAPIKLRLGGRLFVTSLKELSESSVVSPLRGWLSESVCIHRPVWKENYRVKQTIEDGGITDADFYYVRVRQKNDNWAWGSPIWVLR